MVTMGETIWIWSLIGTLFLISIPVMYYSDYTIYGFEFLNPVWLFRWSEMNAIGIVFHVIIYNLISPPITLGYWIYKLFTFKRKKK